MERSSAMERMERAARAARAAHQRERACAPQL
jgi:hypothetical protein